MKREHFEPWTMPELTRAKQMSEAGMPTGSIAILLNVENGTHRTGDNVRNGLRRNLGVRAISGPRSDSSFQVSA